MWWVREGTEEGECHCGAQKETQNEMIKDVTRGIFPRVGRSDELKRERKVGGEMVVRGGGRDLLGVTCHVF